MQNLRNFKHKLHAISMKIIWWKNVLQLTQALFISYYYAGQDRP
jgi:hypothetical protein